MTNPILVEVTRGGAVESMHAGAFAVVDADERIIAGAGDIDISVFPRSAVKAFQALPLVESGVVDAFGFTDKELALICASHGGEKIHVETAAGILRKIKLSEQAYECGAHWPSWKKAEHELVADGEEPRQIHNNCSGKHAGMLALARHLGVETAGYSNRDHPVQKCIAKVIGEMCDIDPDGVPCGIDGCSVPTWAVPLKNLAMGFARFCSGNGLSPERAAAAQRIIAAVRAHPFMVAGSERFCTEVMKAVPRVFVKTGAEGVFCGCVPHAGIGIAIKCNDGGTRAAEVSMAALLTRLPVWEDAERQALEGFARVDLLNCRKINVGDVHAVETAFPKLGFT